MALMLPSLALQALLLALRHRFWGFDSLGSVALGLALLPQFAGYQITLSRPDARGLALGLQLAQWGWFLFALALPGKGPALGAAGLWAAGATVTLPLAQMLRRSGLRHRWIILAGLFATVGCLPFATFSAYFQAFIPLMGEAAAVSSMTQKLFSGAGLWAAIVLLSVVYQSCALGYFYWSRVIHGAAEEDDSWGWDASAASLGLALNAGLGLLRSIYGPLIVGALALLGIDINH